MPRIAYTGAGGSAPAGVNRVRASTNGTLAIVGFFTDSLVLDGTTTLTGAGESAFVAKLTAAGNVTWADSIPDLSSTAPLAIDGRGQIALGISVRSALTFAGQTYPLNGVTDGVALWYGASGEELLALHVGGPGNEPAMHVDFDASDHLLVGLRFSSTINLGDGAHTPDGSDVVLARYSADRAFEWSRAFSAPGSNDLTLLRAGAGNSVYLRLSSFTTVQGWLLPAPVSGSPETVVKVSGTDGEYLWGAPIPPAFDVAASGDGTFWYAQSQAPPNPLPYVQLAP